MASGAIRGTVLLGVLLVGGAFLKPPVRPVDDRILRLEGEGVAAGWYEADDIAAAARLAGAEPPRLASGPLVDGEVVRLVGEWALPDPGAGRVEAMALGRRLRLNSASIAELETLPGIGPALARRIVEGRPFRSLADVDRVRGIGPAKLRAIAPLAEP